MYTVEVRTCVRLAQRCPNVKPQVGDSKPPSCCLPKACRATGSTWAAAADAVAAASSSPDGGCRIPADADREDGGKPRKCWSLRKASGSGSEAIAAQICK